MVRKSLTLLPMRNIVGFFFHKNFFQDSPFFPVLRLFVFFFKSACTFNSLKILTLNFFFHPHQSFKQLNNIGRLMNNSLLPQLITIEVYFKKKAVYNIRSKCNSFSKLKSCHRYF